MNEIKGFFHKKVTKIRVKHKDEILLNDVLSKLNIPEDYEHTFKLQNPEKLKDFLKEIIDLEIYKRFNEEEKCELGKNIGLVLMENKIKSYTMYPHPPLKAGCQRVSCIGITDKNRDKLKNKVKQFYVKLSTQKAIKVYSILLAGTMDKNCFFHGTPKEVVGEISKKLLPPDFSLDLSPQRKPIRITK